MKFQALKNKLEILRSCKKTIMNNFINCGGDKTSVDHNFSCITEFQFTFDP